LIRDILCTLCIQIGAGELRAFGCETLAHGAPDEKTRLLGDGFED